MRWHDELLDDPAEEEDFELNQRTAQPRRERSAGGLDKYDATDGRSSDLVELEDPRTTAVAAGASWHKSGVGGSLVGATGDGGGDCDEDDDNAVLQLLEKVLAKHSAKQRRRPSTAVR